MHDAWIATVVNLFEKQDSDDMTCVMFFKLGCMGIPGKWSTRQTAMASSVDIRVLLMREYELETNWGVNAVIL